MSHVIDAVFLFLRLIFYVIIAQVVLSWLLNFNVLNLRQPTVARIWDMTNRVLAPVYNPIRRVLPTAAGFDFTPMVVIIGILLLEKLIVGLTGYYPAF